MNKDIQKQGYPLFKKFKHLRYDIRDAVLGLLALPRGITTILAAAKHTTCTM
jgi:predicted nucleic acid-binding protein